MIDEAAVRLAKGTDPGVVPERFPHRCGAGGGGPQARFARGVDAELLPGIVEAVSHVDDDGTRRVANREHRTPADDCGTDDDRAGGSPAWQRDRRGRRSRREPSRNSRHRRPRRAPSSAGSPTLESLPAAMPRVSSATSECALRYWRDVRAHPRYPGCARRHADAARNGGHGNAASRTPSCVVRHRYCGRSNPFSWHGVRSVSCSACICHT